MKIAKYVFEVTTFQPEMWHERHVFKDLSQAVAALSSLPSENAVIYVEALGKSVDYGDFYLFLNCEGVAHVMLAEHQEVYAVDPSRQGKMGEIEFLDEAGSAFSVDAALTTSAARGKAALAHWLPFQAHWPQFIWQ